METPQTHTDGIALCEVTVRPVHGVEERRRWDALVARHHYLAFHGLFGKALRHVAVSGQRWLALLGWQAGAFKVGVRDAWIGWPAQRQFRRLHLIANNARFVVLPHARVPNLASRVLGLSLRRVSRDMRALHGYPVLMAETFVDPSRFLGTCYRAANWRWLGLTRGYSREPGGSARWRVNGQPKEVFVYELEADAIEALAGADVPEQWHSEPQAQAMTAPELRSLYAFLDAIPDFRRPRGQRYPLSCYLAIMLAARLAGYRGVAAFGEFGARLSPEQLQAVGALLESQPPVLYRAGDFHLPLHLVGIAARYPGPSPARVGRPVSLSGGARRARRERCAWRIEADRGRKADDGGRRGARQRLGPRTAPGGRQDQRDPGGARIVTTAWLRRAHRHARCAARAAGDRTLSGRRVQGRLRHHRSERQPADYP